MFASILKRLVSPPINWAAVTVNSVFALAFYVIAQLSLSDVTLSRLSAMFLINPCVSSKVWLLALAIILAIIVQMFLLVVGTRFLLLLGQIFFAKNNLFESIKSHFLDEAVFFWKSPNFVQWMILFAVLILCWIVGLSPFAIRESITPPRILEFVVDYQNQAEPFRVKNGDSISIPLSQVVVVSSDVSLKPIYTCVWMTSQVARPIDGQSCLVKYSPQTVTNDLLKVELSSACSPVVSQGSLIIRITP